MVQFGNRSKQSVAQRWREYRPLLTLFSRQHPDPQKKISEWQETFYRRLRILFDAGVRWKAIRNYHMDWPICSEEGFLSSLEGWRVRGKRTRPRTGSHEHYAKNFEKRYAVDQKEIHSL